MLRNLAVGTLAVAGLLSAGTASAAVTPITLGAGDFPGVAVDDAGGAYVAWRGPQDAARNRPLMFCRVPKGATACPGGARALPLPNSVTARPFVFVSGTRVVVLASAVANTAGDVIYLRTSNDGGGTFGPARSVGQVGTLVDAVAGPGETLSFVTSWASNLRFVNVATDATAPVPRFAQMSVPNSELDFGAVGLDGVTPFVLLHDLAGNAAWRRYVSGDFNDDANWTAPSTPGYLGESPHLSSGPLGLFATGRIKPPSLRPAVLKFAGSGFATPATIDATTSGNPIVAQDAGKRLHAIYGSTKLRYAFSDNGATWKAQVLVDEGSSGLPSVAAAPDHSGVVAYWNGTFPGTVRLARLGATASAPAAGATTKTISVAGGKVTLAGPRRCVPPDEPFRARVTYKRAGRLVRVTRVIFYIDGRRQGGADTKAPFSRSLHQILLPPGSAHQLKARVTIRLRNGKTATRTIAVRYSYCAA